MAGTLIGIFLDAVSTYRKPAQFMRKVGDEWESISGERALQDVEQIGLGLVSLGVNPGDRVALLSENRYEWTASDLGILGIGAVTVPIYPTLTADQCCYILNNCEATTIIVSTTAQLEKIRSIAAQCTQLKHIVALDSAKLEGPAELSFTELQSRGAELRRGEPTSFTTRARQVKPDDLATIIYTSGTTGEPKGAMLTHGNIESNTEAAMKVFSVGPDDVNLSFLPLCHIFERMAGLYYALRGGSTIAYAQSTDTVAADAMEVKPTWLLGVPRFYEKVYGRVMENSAKLPPLRKAIFEWGLKRGYARARAHLAWKDTPPNFLDKLADKLVGAKIRERVGGRLQFAVSGGAPLAPHVMEFFFAIGIPVLEGYGLTETSPVICLNPMGKEKPGHVGPVVPGVEMRIADNGEIITRGPHVMKGYYKNEAATRDAIRDGWFHTGDVGEIDNDGYLKITDRIKELIVLAGGKKVAPQPLEQKLKAMPGIAEAVLIGERRAYISCLIVPDFPWLEAEAVKRGWPTDRKQLVAHPQVLKLFDDAVEKLNADCARFEQIKRYELLEEELSQDRDELTPTLKVKRRVIDKRYAGLIEKLYEGHETPAA